MKLKKAIGGLLMVSMLTAPPTADLNYMAYLALRNQIRIVFVDDARATATPEDIDQAMAGMEENSRLITYLLRERVTTLGKLEAKMDILSHARIPLNEEQMARYATFMSNYRKSARDFSLILKAVEGGKNLNIIQKEIMSENTDYNQIMGQLGEIISAQNQAIDNLSQTICEGETLFKQI